LPGTPPLIETKLLPPRGRPELVSRPRLIRALDEFSPAALTLIDAPVGFGKTVLAQSWSAQSDSAIAWVSIDSADDDPVRLWTYVATAVDGIRPGLGRGALTQLRRRSRVSLEAAVDELINGVAAFGHPLAIVLDDLHGVTGEACLRSFERAVERLPPHARVVATTRSDLPIALGRLRARGALGEIRARDLAFTIDEAHELLVEREHIELGDEEVEMLLDRTEGWPAGLYLAALWLRTVDDPKSGARDFHGDHRHVADYLTGEVLETLDADTRDFLVRTSVLDRFNGAICDAVLDRDGSTELIADLERSNLFLIALDPHREWFRYHHLFRELLQLEHRHVDPSAEALLHRRASDWWREHGLIEDALEHAEAAGDDALVAAMLVEHHLEFLRSGRQSSLVRWVTGLPTEHILEHSVLAPAAALALSDVGGDAQDRRRLIALAERSRAERPANWTPYEEVSLGLARAVTVEGNLAEALVLARRTAVLARADEQVAVGALSILALLLFFSGDLLEASVVAQEAVDRPEARERPHGYVHSLATLSMVDAELGRARDAESRARKAVAAALSAGVAETISGGLAHVALARALAVTGRFQEAEREAVLGERLRRQTEPELSHVYASLVLAEIRANCGQLLRASAELARALEALETFSDAGELRELSARVRRMIDDAHIIAGRLEEVPSPAELNVLQLLATELSQREIGSRLFLSVNTVKTHTRALYRKLGSTSREDAVARAAALGLLADDDSPG
jgi:LuxR family maltose regulon positive regulatory protein